MPFSKGRLSFATRPTPAPAFAASRHTEHLYQPATKAGDVVLFSEGTVHGVRITRVRITRVRITHVGIEASRRSPRARPPRLPSSAQLGSVLGSWVKNMRDAVRNKERWKDAVHLPNILVLTARQLTEGHVHRARAERVGGGARLQR